MRLSPVWLTLLTSSATLGFVDTVQGQVLDHTAETVDPSPYATNQEMHQPLVENSEKLAFTSFSEVQENAITEQSLRNFPVGWVERSKTQRQPNELVGFRSSTQPTNLSENGVTEEKTLPFTSLPQPQPLSEKSEQLAFTSFSEVQENAITEQSLRNFPVGWVERSETQHQPKVLVGFRSSTQPTNLSEKSEKLAFTSFSGVQENAITEEKTLPFTSLPQPQPLSEKSEQLAFTPFSQVQENAPTEEQTLAFTSLPQPQPLSEKSEQLAFTSFSEVQENAITEQSIHHFPVGWVERSETQRQPNELVGFRSSTQPTNLSENGVTEEKTLPFTSLPQPQPLAEKSEQLAFTSFSEVQENAITEQSLRNFPVGWVERSETQRQPNEWVGFRSSTQPTNLSENSEKLAFTPFSPVQENAASEQDLRINNISGRGERPFAPTLSVNSLNAQLSQNNSSPSEPRVLVAEVVVRGVDGDLRNRVFDVISTQAGRTTTRSRLQEDIDAIFATGFFSNVRATPEDTPLGVRVTFEVMPNPVLQQVNINANPGTDIPSVVPQEVIDEIFGDQYGRILNLRRFQVSIQDLNTWYQENGYILAQVVDAPDVGDDGTVTLVIPEGVIEGVDVVYLNRDGQDTEEDGSPVQGKTREFVITRQLTLQPGEIFNRDTIQGDLQRVYGLGIFQDVNVTLNPGTDPTKVVVVLNVQEQNTGSIAAGGGISSASGLFGSLSYQETNFLGRNQTLGTEVQLGTRDFLFDVSFTDPWIGGDPKRTAYTINGFRRRSISLVFDGDEDPIRFFNGDRPRVLRTGGGIRFSRPFGENPLKPDWLASLGIQYQHVSIRDADNELTARDDEGQRLAFHNTGIDDLFMVQFGIVSDRRNNPAQPTSGSVTRFSIEQSIPVTSVVMSRLRGSYTTYIPVKFTDFNEGPQTLAFQIEGGATFGDLPPYEAFILGGLESVRGFAEGDVGSGRYFLEGTLEYRFPVSPVFGGVLFIDGATNLGSGNAVIGNPSNRRGLPGSAAAAGIGVRVNTPLGPIRIDYGFNTEGGSRVHFGIGEKF